MACGELYSFFFFFQAEDGIRDLTVTGVQTCALPIYCLTLHQLVEHWGHDINERRIVCLLLAGPDLIIVDVIEVPMSRLTDKRGGESKIGRASCRERV